MRFADALSQYFSTLTPDRSANANQDLLRFGRWYGWERSLAGLAPPEVAKYAEETLAGGGEAQGHLATVKEFLVFLKRKGIVEHSLAPHVKLPRASKVSFASAQTNSRAIPMTAAGHLALHQEMEELKGRRGHVAETIRHAAADKDFSENAPLDAAREVQGKMETRIRELEETLRRAAVVDGAKTAHAGDVHVGSVVVLHDLASSKQVRYLLVDSSEADPSNGKISTASPMGKALVGRYAGDEVEVTVPKGLLRYRIASVGH